ncbi:MAG: sulfatase-like hydrolase/transferase [Planctomycetota bacterium]
MSFSEPPLRGAPPLLALLGLLFLCGCHQRPADVPFKHAIILVLDSTHAAHLGCYGGPPEVSPQLDALARRGARVEWAFTNATWTLPSTVTLMTGRLPQRHGVVLAPHALPEDGLPTLAEIAGQAGFQAAGFTQMIFASDRHGLQRGFQSLSYYGPADGPKRKRMQSDIRDRLAGLGEQPTLTYVHFRRPHWPYDPPAAALEAVRQGQPLEDGRRDADLATFSERAVRQSFVGDQAVTPLTAEESERLVQLYRGGLHAIDAELEELIELLQLRDDTVLVVTSDHGEGLGEHAETDARARADGLNGYGAYGHGAGLWPEHVRVPLIFAGRGLHGTVSDPVSTVDLLPTLAELLGLKAPPGEGRSYAAALRGRPLPPRAPISLLARSGSLHPAAVGSVWKEGAALRFARLTTPGAYELYALDTDGLTRIEQRPPAEIERMLSALFTWQPQQTAFPEAQLSPDDEADLRALGYTR